MRVAFFLLPTRAVRTRRTSGKGEDTIDDVKPGNLLFQRVVLCGRHHPDLPSHDRDELAAAVATFVSTYNRAWRLEKVDSKGPVEARLAFQPPSH